MHVRIKKTIREVYDECILDRRARNLSSYTIRHYETQMAVFLEFHDGENDITTLTAALFQKYVLFCHTYAKKYLVAGGDIFRLSKLLGHSNINITREYLNLVFTDLEQDYGQSNMLEQVAGRERKGKGSEEIIIWHRGRSAVRSRLSPQPKP